MGGKFPQLMHNGLCKVCQFLNLQLPPIHQGYFKKYGKVFLKK